VIGDTVREEGNQTRKETRKRREER